ncbi:hypothetical protein C9J85_17255 [Haloferax sp. wsp5]|nr:hypothetical protein C9J85_17255 [Haloferax sp. wsp5]
MVELAITEDYQGTGVTYSQDWFQYCGVQSYEALSPSFESRLTSRSRRRTTGNLSCSLERNSVSSTSRTTSRGDTTSVATVSASQRLRPRRGQGYDHIEKFDPEQMVERLLGEDE